jgi:hypothetical protein
MRIASGAKTAVTTSEATSTQITSPASTLPCMRPRDALARWLTGFTDTTVCIQPGMVSGLTKMLLTKVSGNRSKKRVVAGARVGKFGRLQHAGVREVAYLAYRERFEHDLFEHKYLGDMVRGKLLYYPTVTREAFRNTGRITDLIESGE